MMNDSDLSGRKSLTLTGKEKDGIVCRVCGEGFMILLILLLKSIMVYM